MQTLKPGNKFEVSFQIMKPNPAHDTDPTQPEFIVDDKATVTSTSFATNPGDGSLGTVTSDPAQALNDIYDLTNAVDGAAGVLSATANATVTDDSGQNPTDRVYAWSDTVAISSGPGGKDTLLVNLVPIELPAAA